jgi:iron(III) transport system ATP-binding protein
VSAAISLRDVTVRRHGVEVLGAVSLDVTAGEVVSLLGHSGSGKTTLLRVIAGLSRPDGGSVLIGDRVVSRDGSVIVSPEDRGVAVVFQDLALWPHLTVHGNLAFGLEAQRVARDEREARIAAMLALVDLGGKAARHPADLSGGERQRVAIARALVLKPAAVLLDEPLANLDLGLKHELLGLFRDLLRAEGSTALHVTHNPHDAEALGSRVAVLESGRLVHVGSLEALRLRGDLRYARDLGLAG